MGLLFYAYGVHRDLHSFPTRRSSDLQQNHEHAGGRHAAAQRHAGFQGRDALPRRAAAAWTDGTCRIIDRKSTRLNSSHMSISYAVFCLKKKIRIYAEPSWRMSRVAAI